MGTDLEPAGHGSVIAAIGPSETEGGTPPRRDRIPLVVIPVHTAVAGRARLHVGGLKGGDGVGYLLERGLACAPGIRSVGVSLLTGNVVVVYDSTTSPHAIIGYIAGLLRGEITLPDDDTSAGSPSAWHRFDPQQVGAQLQTSPATGLSEPEARVRLATAGHNVLPAFPARSEFGIVAAQFQSLPVALLAAAAVLSLATGGLAEAAAIASVVVLNAVIGYQTESRAERTIQSLGVPGPQTARVVRDGSAREVATETVVPGDVLVLRRGMVVPADARLTDVLDLTVSEAALTGESLPVLKSSAVLDRSSIPLGERINMVYRGTIVTGGSGTAIVVGTGSRTEVGRIQRLVATVMPPETPIQRQLGVLGRQLVWITLAAGALIAGLGWLRGFALLQMARSALATAVAAVPEGLPMVSTTTLALGIEDMRRRGVLVRRLDAVETLAAVRVVCFDKTGTLTFGRMSVEVVVVGDRICRARQGILLDQNGLPAHPDDRLMRLLTIGSLCSETQIEEHDGETVLNGSATENALVQAALDNGLDVQGLRREFSCLAVQHRTEAYRFMATTHASGGSLLVGVKGSPSDVLSRCLWEAQPAGRRRKLTQARRREIEETNAQMADEAFRVLGFASRRADAAGSAPPPADDLTWIGLAGMADPVRPGLNEIMDKLHRAGLHTIMLTGDQSGTARAVAEQIGLDGAGSLVVLDAAELEAMGPDQVAAAALRAHAFSRVSPAQKLQIVRMLQQSGAVVAMVGDGINDGPALRAADVGIGLGRDGAAPAREVADAFLANDDLAVLAEAVERGRTTYTNIRKSIRYLLSTNLSEIILMLAGTGFGLAAPLSPLQLLWINLISDVLPGIGLALEPPAPDAMQQPPMEPNEPIVRTEDLAALGGEAAILSAGACGAAIWGALRHGAASPQTQTMTFGSLVTAQLLHALSCRSPTQSVFDGTPRPPNRALSTILGGSLAVQGAALFVPGIRTMLGIARIGPLDAIVTLAGGVLPFVANEALKARRTGAAASALLPSAGTGDRSVRPPAAAEDAISAQPHRQSAAAS